MLEERLKHLPDSLAAFSIAPPASDRAAWAGLPEDLAKRLVSDGELTSCKPWPALPASLYLGYTRSGDRLAFESAFFERRRQLNDLVLAECIEARGRFLDGIVDRLWSVAEESGWQLPAHNAYARGGARLPLPDPHRPVIDLFAAETGALIAVALHLLRDRLEQAAPGLTCRLVQELEHRILKPYLSQHFWWMGNGDEPMNNWTIWCTQNVLWTAFLLPEAINRRPDILKKAAISTDCFLKDYGKDGACEEGAQYYRHAGLCLFNALKTLSTVAPVAFEPIFAQAKIRNIAEYILHAHVEGRYYINFADCAAVCDPCSAREFLFGRAVGSQALMDFAASDWADGGDLTLKEEINLGYRLQAIFTAPEMRAHQRPMPRKPDIFYPSIGLFIVRDSRHVVAVKAGNNGDSHNHNDTGSFIIYRDGRPLFIDIGVGSYTAKTFSPDRYSIWTMQSGFHNLPSFDGVMQKDGRSFAARAVKVSLGDERSTINMELAGAYPPEAGLRSYHRQVTIEKDRGIEILDRHDGTVPAELTLMVADKPVAKEGLLVIGDVGAVAIDGAAVPIIEEIVVDDARLRLSWPDRIYRVRLPLTGDRIRMTIEERLG